MNNETRATVYSNVFNAIIALLLGTGTGIGFLVSIPNLDQNLVYQSILVIFGITFIVLIFFTINLYLIIKNLLK